MLEPWRWPWTWVVPCVVGASVASCEPTSKGEASRAATPDAATGSKLENRTAAELPASVRTALGRAPGARVLLRRKGRDVLAFRVSSADAVREWEKLHAARATSGLYPVIMGAEDDWELPESEAQAPLAESPEAWFERRRKWLDEQGEDGHWEVPRGARIEPSGQSEPYVLRDILSGEPREDLVLALFPVREGWEVASFLDYGGWNDCPPGAEHALVWRGWQERFGAELIALTLDTVELRVARRPASPDAALALAMDQYVYCYDIVDQGVETVDALAATLEGSDYWFFWWD